MPFDRFKAIFHPISPSKTELEEILRACQVQKILLESLEKERNAPRSLFLGSLRWP